MNYGQIKTCDIANGVGVRVTLFVSGCTNHCYNCFQPQTWDFHYGQPFDAAAEQIIFNELEKPFIRGLTLLGIQAVGGGIQPGGFHGGRPLDGQQRLRRAGRFLPRLIDKQTGLPRQAVDIGGAEDGHFTIGPVVAG